LGHRGLVSSPVFVASILNLSQGTNRRDYYFLWNPPNSICINRPVALSWEGNKNAGSG
jgi:hypothetical protein